MTIALAIASAVIVLALLIRRSLRWPTLNIYPYECYACRKRYSTAKHLVAHMHGNHDVDFDDHEVTVIRGYTLGGDK